MLRPAARPGLVPMDEGSGRNRPGPAGGSPLSLSLVRDGDITDGLAAEWLDLAARNADSTCFMLPSFYLSWRDTLRGDAASLLLVVRDRGRLVGVLPMMLTRVRRGPSLLPRYDYAPEDLEFVRDAGRRWFRLRQASPVLSLPAQLIGPLLLCEPGYEAGVIGRVCDALSREVRGWDLLVVPSFDDETRRRWLDGLAAAGFAPAIHRLGRVIQNIARPVPFDDLVARQDKKYRQNVRRARAAAAEAGLEFRMCVGRDEVAARWGWFVETAAASWKQPGSGPRDMVVPLAGRQQAFVERLVFGDGLGAVPILALASIGDRPVASMLCLLHERRFNTLLTFRDPGVAAAASPGLLLLGHAIDWACAAGATRIDLNATHEWVRHLVDESRPLDDIVVFRPSIRGRVLSLVSRSATAARAFVRARREALDRRAASPADADNRSGMRHSEPL